MISGQQLVCRHVQDGLVIDNLCAGDFVVTGWFYPYLKALHEGGGLWPFTIELVSYSYPNDTCVVRLKEQ